MSTKTKTKPSDIHSSIRALGKRGVPMTCDNLLKVSEVLQIMRVLPVGPLREKFTNALWLSCRNQADLDTARYMRPAWKDAKDLKGEERDRVWAENRARAEAFREARRQELWRVVLDTISLGKSSLA